jgi:hypothetical protein
MRHLPAVFAALLCTVGLLAGGFVATAAAASDTNTYSFDSCTGPSGPLAPFTAVKTELPASANGPVSAAAAFRLVDGSAIFVVLSFGAGNFSPPGISQSAAATVTCTVHFTSGPVIVSGLLAPPQ